MKIHFNSFSKIPPSASAILLPEENDGSLDLGFPYYHVSDTRPISRREWTFLGKELKPRRNWAGLRFLDLDYSEEQAAAYQIYRACCGPAKTGADFEHYIAAVMRADGWDIRVTEKQEIDGIRNDNGSPVCTDGGLDAFGARQMPCGREHILVQTKCWHPARRSSVIARATCYEFAGIVRDLPGTADPIGNATQAAWLTDSTSAHPTRVGYFVSTCGIKDGYRKIIQGRDGLCRVLDGENLIDWLVQKDWRLTGLYKSSLALLWQNE